MSRQDLLIAVLVELNICLIESHCSPKLCISDRGYLRIYGLRKNYLTSIYIHPKIQKQGIGRQLLAHAKKQHSTLTLSVYKENEASCSFYLSQGFKVISEQKCKHTGHPELTMRWGLN